MGILSKIKKQTDKEEVKDVKAADEKVQKEKEPKAPKQSGGSFLSHASGIVVRPLVTEKTAVLASQNTYVFVVSNKANKVSIATAIKGMYGIRPTSVNIQNVRGKRVRFGKIKGRRKGWKKAIVTLPKGKTIDVYEGV
jgi:large subunit ribosomal protein L23